MKPKYSLSDLISNGKITDVESKLKTFGVAVLPDFVDGKELEKLQKEYERLRRIGKTHHCPEIIRNIGGPKKDYFAYDRYLDANNSFPEINSFFSHPIMNEMVDRVIGRPCLYSAEIYATFDEGEGKEVLPSHFDKTWNLKFMLYLNDINNEGEGAFGVHPKTTSLARAQFKEWFNTNKRFGAVKVGSEVYYSMTNQELPADLTEFVEIHGNAGTLIVFNTDCFHSASRLNVGNTRKILRAHTYPQRKMLGIDDRLSTWSRHYSRGEAWEINSIKYSKRTLLYWLELGEHFYSILTAQLKNWKIRMQKAKLVIYRFVHLVLVYMGIKNLVKKILGLRT